MTRALMAVYAAGALAMVGALFGVVFARFVWASDLKHAEQLRKIWDQTERSLQEQIRSQQEQIKLLRR